MLLAIINKTTRTKTLMRCLFVTTNKFTNSGHCKTPYFCLKVSNLSLTTGKTTGRKKLFLLGLSNSKALDVTFPLTTSQFPQEHFKKETSSESGFVFFKQLMQ
jgi:hypothetical protein